MLLTSDVNHLVVDERVTVIIKVLGIFRTKTVPRSGMAVVLSKTYV